MYMFLGVFVFFFLFVPVEGFGCILHPVVGLD